MIVNHVLEQIDVVILGIFFLSLIILSPNTVPFQFLLIFLYAGIVSMCVHLILTYYFGELTERSFDLEEQINIEANGTAVSLKNGFILVLFISLFSLSAYLIGFILSILLFIILVGFYFGDLSIRALIAYIIIIELLVILVFGEMANINVGQGVLIQ